jgi:hypothetical protein
MRIGPVVGLSGLRIGLGEVSAANPMAGVTQDATSLKYVPANAAEWAQTMEAAGIASGNPFALWLLQEASGSPADSIGAFTLSVNSFNYQNAVAGWTRKSMDAGDIGSEFYLATGSAALPQLDIESCTVLMYAAITATPAGDRSVVLAGDFRANVTSSNVPKANNGTTTATGAQSVTTAVRPWVIRHNVAASTQAVFTDLEKVIPVFGASSTSKRIFFGGAIERNPDIKILYACAFRGAAAEMTDTQLRTLLQTLGWTIGW